MFGQVEPAGEGAHQRPLRMVHLERLVHHRPVTLAWRKGRGRAVRDVLRSTTEKGRASFCLAAGVQLIFPHCNDADVWVPLLIKIEIDAQMFTNDDPTLWAISLPSIWRML
jgi:hypothetical protein